MPELHAARTPPRWQRAAVDLYLAIRFSAFGFTGLLPLVGAASVAPDRGALVATGLLGVAVAFHVFAYMFNDVVDFWVDRSEPLRADSPLLRGVISRTQAMVIVGLQLPLAFGAAWAAGADAAALGWLALAFVAMALYDLYGKRCPWPLLTDAVQSAGWSALLLFGAAFTAVPGRATAWLAAAVFFCVMLVNGVHGSLRDLANDHARGARTTALWLGARAAPGAAGVAGAVCLSPWLVRYAAALQLAFSACALAAWQALDYGSRVTDARAIGVVLTVLGAAALSLIAVHRQAADRRAFVAAGAWNIVTTLAVLPALVLPLLGLAEAAFLVAVFTLPVLAMWAYNGAHWGLGRDPP